MEKVCKNCKYIADRPNPALDWCYCAKLSRDQIEGTNLILAEADFEEGDVLFFVKANFGCIFWEEK